MIPKNFEIPESHPKNLENGNVSHPYKSFESKLESIYMKEQEQIYFKGLYESKVEGKRLPRGSFENSAQKLRFQTFIKNQKRKNEPDPCEVRKEKAMIVGGDILNSEMKEEQKRRGSTVKECVKSIKGYNKFTFAQKMIWEEYFLLACRFTGAPSTQLKALETLSRVLQPDTFCIDKDKRKIFNPAEYQEKLNSFFGEQNEELKTEIISYEEKYNDDYKEKIG